MDLIIYGEKKTSLEMMPQAAADCAAKHMELSRFFYRKKQFLKMDVFSLACLKEPLSSFLQIFKGKKECCFVVLLGFLASLHINSHLPWKCLGKKVNTAL